MPAGQCGDLECVRCEAAMTSRRLSFFVGPGGDGLTSNRMILI
jgi:hypothetical protein